MSERYRNSKILKDDNDKRYREVTIYPKIERELNDIYIISKPGDRLDHYAQKYYNDPTDWWIIAQANHLGKGSLNVEPGLQIRIPIRTNDIDDIIENTNNNL